MHIVTLSFDDFFAESTRKTARIYEKFGLSACFNVLAGAHTPDFTPIGYLDGELGGFELCNELVERGHEVMPHGWVHNNLTRMPLEKAQRLVCKCLDAFEDNLRGFRRDEAVFNFPYNASSGELDQWLPTQVRAFRTWGDGVNPLPSADTVKLTCTSHGPESCEDDIDRCVDKLLAQPSGWLIYNTHGLDGEGWGPVRSEYLERLLERLLSTAGVQILPAGRVLSQAAG